MNGRNIRHRLIIPFAANRQDPSCLTKALANKFEFQMVGGEGFEPLDLPLVIGTLSHWATRLQNTIDRINRILGIV